MSRRRQSDGLIPAELLTHYDPRKPQNALIDDFAQQICLKKDGRRSSAAKQPLQWTASPAARCQDVNQMPVIVTDDQAERCSSADLRLDECRVVIDDTRQRLRALVRMPFVELDVMEEEYLRPYWDKYNGEQFARDMAKRPERCSDRKRKADTPLPTASSSARKSQIAVTSSGKKKRLKISASPGQSLVPVTNTARSKKRMFEKIPASVPNYFKRVGEAHFLDQMRDCSPERGLQFESPFPVTDLFDHITFEELLEIADCSSLMELELELEKVTCQEGEMTNADLSDVPDQCVDQPRPVTCSPLPAATAAVSYSESCEPFQSPPQVVADHSPDLLTSASLSHFSLSAVTLNQCESVLSEQSDPVTVPVTGKEVALPSNNKCESEVSAGQSGDTKIVMPAAVSAPALPAECHTSFAASPLKEEKPVKSELLKVECKLNEPDVLKTELASDTKCSSSSSVMSSSASESAVPSAKTGTDRKKLKKQEPEVRGEDRRPCDICFLSKLRLTPSEMQKHIRFAHANGRTSDS
jgi:hypothetical protein